VRAIIASVLALATLLTVGADIATAQDRQSLGDDLSLSVGGRLWVTSGYSSRTISASGARVSELRWRGVDALVPEANIELVWRRLVVLGSIGGGVVNDGVLIDEDFTDGGTRFSTTRSPVDDSYLFYLSTDVGARVADWTLPAATARGYVDVLVGFQYWHEHYVAFGGTGSPDPVGNNGIKALTNDYEWYSLRLGARTRLPIYRGLSVSLAGYVIPWSSLIIEDIHHLRTDLRQDPSFRDDAQGGLGWQGHGAIEYAFTNRLTAELGFQYWTLKSAEGDSIAFTSAGSTRQTLKEARSERYGPFVGVRWRF
jgi:hypothetical protein